MNATLRVFIAVIVCLAAADAVAQAAIPPNHQNNRWYRRPETDVAIVFVHGIFSDSHECWTAKNGAYWPEIVKKDPVFAKAGIYLAGYETAVRSKNRGMYAAADELFDALNRDGVVNISNLLFVCHSTGGIVVRYMFTDEWQTFATKNIGLALYASPTKGSRIADVVGSVAKAMGQKLGFQLGRRSELLVDLHDRFLKKVSQYLNVNLVGMELCETDGLPVGPLIRKVIVPCDSAGAYFGVQKMIGRDHSQTVKPVSQSDEPNVRLENFYTARFGELLKRSDSTMPDLACVYPPEAAAGADFPILISGSAFRVGVQARIGGERLVIEKFTPTGIVAKVPASIPAGKRRVVVKNPSSAEVEKEITIHPRVTGVTPVTVSVRGGEKLTIRGDGFDASELLAVRVCGFALESVQVLSSKEIIGNTPKRLSSERCTVAVELRDGLSASIGQAVRYDPVVFDVQPANAPTDTVAPAGLSGIGFQESAQVAVGGTPAEVRFVSAASLAVTIPARATTGPVDVVVAHADGTTTTLPNAFTYTPSIARIDPANGPLGGGNMITITGSGFAATTKVSFGDTTLAATVFDSHTLTVAAPSQAAPGAVDVTVRNGDGTSTVLGRAYAYDPLAP